MENKVAVFGASGFLGAALCERLYFSGETPFVALIHNYGVAARLARLPIDIQHADVLDGPRVEEVMRGCHSVVNCSRGSDSVMLKGLKNLIDGARKTGVKRFIHISSTAIYGQDPASDAHTEQGVPRPGDNEYARLKLRQDEMVLKMHREGIASLILCPGNIIGPYSQFVTEAAQELLSEQVMLVDEGRYPTNLIHVDNLAHAIVTALRQDNGWGERYFINEPEPTTWREWYTELARQLGVYCDFHTIEREKVLERLAPPPKTSASTLKILVSGEFRKALSMLPWFARLNEIAYQRFHQMPTSLQSRIRERLERSIVIRKDQALNLRKQLIRVQVRKVFHSPARLMERLGYRPLLDPEERIRSLVEWLRFARVA